MKRKLGMLLLGLTMTFGMVVGDHHRTLSSAQAQSAPAELELQPMNINRLDAILQEQVGNVAAQPGQWRFSLNGISLVVLADPNANRMRIFAPVTNAAELTAEQMQRMMLANFHTTLDARYAIADGLVVSTFIHPLSSLQERDLLSAINQVSSLAVTFGSSYTSGEMIFAPGGNRENTPAPEILSQEALSADLPRSASPLISKKSFIR